MNWLKKTEIVEEGYYVIVELGDDIDQWSRCIFQIVDNPDGGYDVLGKTYGGRLEEWGAASRFALLAMPKG